MEAGQEAQVSEAQIDVHPTAGVSEAIPLQSLDQAVRIELASHRGSRQSSTLSTSSGGRSRWAIARTVEREI